MNHDLVSKCALSASAGFFVGTLSMALVAKNGMDKFVKKTLDYDARRAAFVTHMIDAMGPYAPKEVLDEILAHAEFNSIITHNEGPQ